MSFTVASYNILADAYLRRGWYPQVPPALLERRARRAAMLERVAGLGADVLCLQEVEKGALADLAERLRPRGYLIHHARKAAGKPDGCATLVRGDRLAVRAVKRVAFADGHDGLGASGHVALLLTLEHEGRLVCVVNTHVRWDPPETPPGGGWAPRQLRELLARLPGGGSEGDEGDELDRGAGAAAAARPEAPEVPEVILCGDLNLRPDSPVLALLRGAGLRDSHDGPLAGPTCHVNGRAVRIDYLWHSTGLRAEPSPLPPLSDDTPLPSVTEPSDHLPVLARFHAAP